MGGNDGMKGDMRMLQVAATLYRCNPNGLHSCKFSLQLLCDIYETVQDMFMIPLDQQYASHTLALRAIGPQPHMRS